MSVMNVATVHTNLKKSFQLGKSKSYQWRISQLKALKRMLNENETAIMEATASDLGRGFFEALGLELVPMAMEIDHALLNLQKWMAPVFTQVLAMMAPATSEYVYEPYGVVLVIGAFNYPILLSLSPLIGAIIAGNCALLKPSDVSKASEKLLATLLPKYLDTECIQVITGGIETNTALLELRWNKIFFTGSTRVGKIVAQAAAKHLTPVSLELGGKSPTVVDEMCGDMEVVCRRILWGKLSNAGQTCIAPDYVLCHASKYEEFLSTSVKVLKSFLGPDPSKSEHFSRIVSAAHCERLKGLLADAGGGSVVTGGNVNVLTRYVEPTILRDVKLDSVVMKEEIFGPIMPVISYRRTEDAIAIINSETLEKPLALYIFSKNRGMIDRVVNACPSGGVVINDVVFHFLSPFIPFGGIGTSGMGGYHGFYSFEAFSHRKSITRRDDSSAFDLSIRYPPYTKMGLSIFRFIAMKGPYLPSITGLTFTLGLVGVGMASLACFYFTSVVSIIHQSDIGSEFSSFAKGKNI